MIRFMTPVVNKIRSIINIAISLGLQGMQVKQPRRK